MVRSTTAASPVRILQFTQSFGNQEAQRRKEPVSACRYNNWHRLLATMLRSRDHYIHVPAQEMENISDGAH